MSSLLFFKVPASTDIYTLSLHDALPICQRLDARLRPARPRRSRQAARRGASCRRDPRSEEHTSELQSRGHLVCRLLLEKKKRRKMVFRQGEDGYADVRGAVC